jgi:hypothetical protein
MNDQCCSPIERNALSTINGEPILMNEQTSQSTLTHVAISASQARGDIALKTLSLADGRPRSPYRT